MAVNSLGFDLSYEVPSTVAEYDRLAKKVGAALESANLNVIYRSVFAKFRAAFLDAVVNNTGIERATEAVKNKDGSAKTEDEEIEEENDKGEMVKTTIKTPVLKFVNTEKVDFELICAQLVQQGKYASTEAAAASFKDLAQGTLEKIVFDPSETEKTPSGPKTIAKAYTKIAQKAADTGKLETLAAALGTKLGALWKVEATVDSVARAISEDQRRQREAKNVGAEYGVES